MQRQVDDQRHLVSSLQSSLRAQMDNQSRLIASLQQVVQAQSSAQPAAETTIHMLHGMGTASHALGTLVMSPRTPLGVLIVHNLPANRVGLAFDCWVISRDGTRTYVGTVVVDQEGNGYMPVVAPRALNAYHMFGVTAKAAGGQKVLEGPVS
jgi:hypothetical protein